MFLTRRRPEVILIGMLFLAFISVTAVFWAHSSHRSYLDVYWIVFAASVVEKVWTTGCLRGCVSKGPVRTD